MIIDLNYGLVKEYIIKKLMLPFIIFQIIFVYHQTVIKFYKKEGDYYLVMDKILITL